MKKFALFCVALSIEGLWLPLAGAAAPADSTANALNPRAKAEWNASLGGRFVDDNISEAKIAALNANVRGVYEFSAALAASVELGLALETGTTQALFTDEFRPEQQILLHDARVKWRPFEFFSFHAGAINQSHHRSDLFMGGKTFPALLETISFLDSTPFHGMFVIQQAIPTSQTFSQRSIGKEPTPFLHTGRLELRYEDADGFLLQGRGTYFRFSNLTRGVAQDSRFYGNTVLGTGIVGARFFYPFSGWETGLDSRIPLSAMVRVLAGNSFMNNTKAPRPRNRAFLAYIGTEIEGNSFIVTPKFSIFRSENDAVPGFYSAKQYGHNNRKGWAISVALRLKEEKVTLEGSFVKANVILVSPLQADRNYAQISLSTDFQAF